MILVIDNYDSFVHNLARYIELAGMPTHIRRNDEITIDDIRAMKPEAIVISPGPCTPEQAGISRPLIEALGAELPILGVCLGHQAIGEAYGGRTVRATSPMHGKASRILHDGSGIFKELKNDFDVGRYHSLVVALQDNSPLNIAARTEAGDIMAVQHKTHPVYGVQFHPESILTTHGDQMVQNFIQIAHAFHQSKDTEIAA